MDKSWRSCDAAAKSGSWSNAGLRSGDVGHGRLEDGWRRVLRIGTGGQPGPLIIWESSQVEPAIFFAQAFVLLQVLIVAN